MEFQDSVLLLTHGSHRVFLLTRFFLFYITVSLLDDTSIYIGVMGAVSSA